MGGIDKASLAVVSATAVGSVLAEASVAAGAADSTSSLLLLLLGVSTGRFLGGRALPRGEGDGTRLPLCVGVDNGVRKPLPLLPGVCVVLPVLLLPRTGVLAPDLRGVGSLNLDRVGRGIVVRGGGPWSLRTVVTTLGDEVAGGSKIVWEDSSEVMAAAAAAAAVAPAEEEDLD